MEVFKTHPSVRVKGTEDNYEPVACSIPECVKRSPHMHCPFCLKSDSFIDPVILKAHYRVKHVDKGIEFAGLKILRCCDQCSIVGSIKNNKEFKGAHWHCYNCRNGFNRRDEALKHYKTHFRNPMTTFQIQITHDINHHMMRLPQEVEFEHTLEVLPEESGGLLLAKTHPWVVSNETIISSVSDTADSSHEESVLNSTHDNGIQDKSLTSSQTDGVPRIVLVEPQQQLSGGRQEETQYFIVGENGKLTAADPPMVTSQQVLTDSFVETDHLEKDQLVARITELHTELSDTETLYQEKILALQNLVDDQQKKITALEQRERELMNQLRQNLSEEQVSDILSEMKLKQEELLNHCLSKLKRSNNTVSSSNVSSVTMVTAAQSSQATSEVGDTFDVVVHSSQDSECLNGEVVNVIDSTSHFTAESAETDDQGVHSIKVEGSTTSMLERCDYTNTHVSSDVEIDIPGSSEIPQTVDAVSSEIYIDTGSHSNHRSKPSSKVVNLPLSRLFTSGSSTSPRSEDISTISSEGEVYFFVQTSDSSEVPLLDGQNSSVIDKECLVQDSEVGIPTSSNYHHTDTSTISTTDAIVEMGTHCDDIIESGDYVTTSNVDVITEVSTTGAGCDLKSESREVSLDNVDYHSGDFIVPHNSVAVSEHQYAVIEQDIEVGEDDISSDPVDVKLVSFRRGKRKASTSPDASPLICKSKRQRKPLVKESL